MTGGGTALTPRALERRVKRWLLGAPFDCFVQCPAGLEEVLAGEVAALGLAPPTGSEVGGVRVPLTHLEVMSANLALRTATRILLRIGEFHAGSSEALYDHVRHLPWEVQLGAFGEYSLRVSSRNSKLQAGDAVERTISQAVARRMGELGASAKLVVGAPLSFWFRFSDDRAQVSFNTSGEALHRRGQRRHVGAAPLRESLAAAMALTGMRGHDVVVDPFCGSGTLLIEASDVAHGRLPGRARCFAFEQAAWFRDGAWNEARRQAAALVEPRGQDGVRLIGIDDDRRALQAAKANLQAPEYASVELLRADSTALDLQRFEASRGLLLSNLPYGVRLGDRVEAGRSVDAFLRRCSTAVPAWDFVFLTQHPELFANRSGVEVAATATVNNGGLAVTMISGSLGAIAA